MEEKNTLHFSEYDFGGIHDLDLSWDDDKLEASYVIHDGVETASDRSGKREWESEEEGTSADIDRGQFYIYNKGNLLYWRNIESISYYEIDQVDRYGFRVALQTKDIKEEIVIYTRTIEKVIMKTTREVDRHSDILDSMIIKPHNESSFLLQKTYLQKMYNTLIEEIVPVATKVLVKRYERRLRSNQIIEIGEVMVQKKGIFMQQKKRWFLDDTILVDWKDIEVVYEQDTLYLRDQYDNKTSLKISRHDLINKDALEALIALGKKGELE
jgi:hypothetical protein